MATSKTKNRPRPGAQGGRSGSGNGARNRRTSVRRPPPRRSLYSAFALPLVVLGVFLIVAVALVVLYRTSTTSGNNGQPVANVKCDSTEQLATHYHAHLDILYQGQPVKVPPQVGIQTTCLYWLHTHDDTGVIHIEAPRSEASRQFKLGEFFKVWGQPLSNKQVATIQVASGEQVKAWVNGQPYTRDPASIPLTSKEQIVLEIGPPFVDPPPTYAWDPNTYAQ